MSNVLAASCLAVFLFVNCAAEAAPAGAGAPPPAAPVSAGKSVAETYRAPTPESPAFDGTAGTGSYILGGADNAMGGNADDSGLAALVSPSLKGAGFLTAQVGSVTLGSGAQATVDLAGDSLISIALDANKGAVPARGSVTLSAHAARHVVDGAVNMGGVHSANSFSSSGGAIVLGDSQAARPALAAAPRKPAQPAVEMASLMPASR